MNYPKVTIITLNYNQNQYTIDCVNSVLKSDYSNFEIILVDNGSTLENFKDLEIRLPKDSRLIVTRYEENTGYVGGVNKGLSLASKTNTDYLLVMNNDTLIDYEAINALVRASIEYNDKVIVSGKVYHYDEPNKLQDIGRDFVSEKNLTFKRLGLNELDSGQFNKVEQRDMLDDVFWLFSSKLYSEIGEYSSYFWFNGEQADFALRAKNVGYKLLYTPNAKIWHKGSVSIGGRKRNPTQAYWSIQSGLILRYLHLKKPYFLKYYSKIFAEVILTYVKLIFYGYNLNNRNYAFAKLKAFLYFNKWVLIKNQNIGKSPNL
tara:strand:+ start:11260 stop:12213 length:954 start_codon:yes stop_codon:yes gene_type:complete